VIPNLYDLSHGRAGLDQAACMRRGAARTRGERREGWEEMADGTERSADVLEAQARAELLPAELIVGVWLLDSDALAAEDRCARGDLVEVLVGAAAWSLSTSEPPRGMRAKVVAIHEVGRYPGQQVVSIAGEYGGYTVGRCALRKLATEGAS
jgi:hypothetical protein